MGQILSRNNSSFALVALLAVVFGSAIEPAPLEARALHARLTRIAAPALESAAAARARLVLG
jgi:hypothetical protein